jgi:hypothetical protein
MIDGGLGGSVVLGPLAPAEGASNADGERWACLRPLIRASFCEQAY